MYTGAGILVGYLCLLPIISSCTDGSMKSALYYLHALGVSCIAYILLNSNSGSSANTSSGDSEVYGLKHLLFNIELPPKTLWFNMGLWDKPNLTFPQACENLVNAVTKLMDLQPRSKVLDVGFGCGDSCIMLAEKYEAKVTGITNELSQFRIAKDRIVSTPLEEKIQLVHGSADDLSQHIASNEIYDSIISIDSAYHYNTRWDFLKNAFQHLKPEGGCIGLYDLCVDPEFLKSATPMQSMIFKLVCDAVRIPSANLVTAEEYGKRMAEIGYTKVELLNMDREQVFGGLSKSFQTQYEEVNKFGIGVSLSNKAFLKVSAFLFGLLGEKPWIVPIIVKGEKQ